MVSSLLGGIMNIFSDNDGDMIKEDEQGGGRHVRRIGQTFSETTRSGPTKRHLDSTLSPSTLMLVWKLKLTFLSLAKGDYVDSQFSHLGLTVSAAGGMDTRPRVFDTANPVDE